MALLATSAVGQEPGSGKQPDAVERLRALPYLSVTEGRADARRRGVLRHDVERSHPGFTLYTGTGQERLELLSPTGRPVHSWPIPAGDGWFHAKLLADGDLVAIGGRRRGRAEGRPATAAPSSEGAGDAGSEDDGDEDSGALDVLETSRYILRMDWDGRVLWKHSLAVHHDLEIAPDGRILTFSTQRRLIPEVDPAVEVLDDTIEVFSPAGERLESRSLFDLLSSDPEVLDLEPVRPRRRRGGGRSIDLLHANNLDWVDLPALRGRHPIYGADHLLVTLRHQDAVAAIHWPTGRLVWAWGAGELSGPHHAQVLPSGNVLVFDNGLASRSSRVVELDPRSGEIVWEFRAPEGRKLFTRSGGACQRLANGNTLVVSTNQGYAFEVTPAGEPVWEFYNPAIGPHRRRGVIVRMWRYETELVRGLGSRPRSPRRPRRPRG